MEVVAIAVAALGLLGVLLKLVTVLIERQKQVHAEVKEVHVLVNDRMTEALKRIDQLTEAMRKAGVDVPDHPDRD